MAGDLDDLAALMPFAGHLGLTLEEASAETQMFRPVSGGTVRAVAIPLHRGRTTVTAQTSLYGSDERLVALTTQVQAVR